MVERYSLGAANGSSVDIGLMAGDGIPGAG